MPIKASTEKNRKAYFTTNKGQNITGVTMALSQRKEK